MKHFCLLAGGLLLSGAARSQTLENGGFETPQPGPRQLPAGWAIAPAPGYSIALDSTTAPAGRRSLRLASTADNPPGFQPFRQSVAVQVAHPTILHLRASIKTQEADNVALLCQYWDDTKMVGLTNSLMQGALPTGTGEWRTLDIALLVLPAMRRVVVGGFYVGRGQAWFDEVRLGSPVQYPPGPPAALVRDYIGEVVDIARTHSLVRDSVDWPQLQSELLAMAHGMKTPADSHPIFSYLISVLRQYGDQHSRFNGPAAVSARHAPATAAHATALEEPGARYLGQGLAYVAVPGFGSVNAGRGVKFASQLQALIRQLDSEYRITGWVVDLRGNAGGNMYPMLAGLGPLVGTGTLGYFLTAGQPLEPFAYRAGEAYANQPGHGTRVPQPYRLRRPGSPVAVLVGPRTASSGEITALAFLGRPATRLFGQPTAGFTTANQPFRLTDGAELNLAVSTEADRTGHQYAGPLVPAEAVPAAPAAGSDPALRAATAWLRKQASAGKS